MATGTKDSDRSSTDTQVKISLPQRLFVKLLDSPGLLLGFLCLALSAASHRYSDRFVFLLGTIFLAEFGAVVLSINILHLLYEKYMRDEYASTLREIIKSEFDAAKSAPPAYLSFRRIGMKEIYEELSAEKVCKLLEKSKQIDVMKTWFPDHPRIKEGFELAFKHGARVRLLLNHPDSEILKLRSAGAGKEREHGSQWIIQTLCDLHRLAGKKGAGKFEIGLHHEWPGCPIIWYDGKVLLGFYLRGWPSPLWPWIAVEDESRIGHILRKQFDDLWDKVRHSRIKTPEELGIWLEDRAAQGNAE